MKSKMTFLSVVAALITTTSPNAISDDSHGNPGSHSESSDRNTSETGSNRKTLRARKPFDKPLKSEKCASCKTDEIVIKFKDGTGVRQLSDDELIGITQKLNSAEYDSLVADGLDSNKIGSDLVGINGLVRHHKGYINRGFERSELDLDQDREQGEKLSGEQLVDLNLFYHLKLPNDTTEETALQIIDSLNLLPSVEIAYLQPRPARPPMADINPTTPSYEPNQGYFAAAPFGIDARYAWTLPGGRGAGVRIIDVENDWLLIHEDLTSPFFRDGAIATNASTDSDFNHGAGVLGITVAGNNGYGVTGIASDADFGVSSAYRSNNPIVFSVPNAINAAATSLRFGDILLVEEQYPATSGIIADYAPVENYPEDYAAIYNAAWGGITVVEAAGNGGQNLSAAKFGRRFDLSYRDSGAIIVGAGSWMFHSPLNFSTYGPRVDVQGWGESVMTLGYGGVNATIRINGSDPKQVYRTDFSGTSSASAIVAGAAASIQGIRRARGLSPLSSVGMRALLRSSGTPQAADAHQIGPLPNIYQATRRLDCGFLFPHQRLYKGESISACNGSVKLIYQTDGNVVLYNMNGKPIWNTNTVGKSSITFGMDGVGLLGLWSGQDYVWRSSNALSSGAYLAIQDDRNVVIYSRDNKAIWNTGTVGK